MLFIPSFGVILAYTAAAAILTITPGPDMTLFLSKTLTQGRKAGILSVLGSSSGAVVHSLLAALGISALVAASITAFTVLKFIGALYLIWLAIQTLRHGSALTLKNHGPARSQSAYRVWAQAVMVNLLNPKVVLFFVTFLPQFITAGDPYTAGKLLFLGLYFVCFSTIACIGMVLVAERLSNFLKSSPRAMRVIDWSCASIFSAFALKLLAAHSTSA